MKKGLLLSLIAVLIVSLAACGAPTEKKEETTTAAKVEETTTEAKAEESKEDKKEEDKKEDDKAAAEETGVYTLVNKTGEKVVELYHYANDSKDKGENLAGEGLEDGKTATSTVNLAADKTEDFVSTLEFKTESGYEAKFEKLHFETVEIELLAEDAMTGATPIAFVKGK
ncbi:MAG: cytochrome C [Eubacteriales bacterium]|nr:cytochrome C [Eubacteriales bacterium]